MDNWKPIATAPRDGRQILVTAIEDDGGVFEIHEMKWGGTMENPFFAPDQVGMWVAPGGSYTWREGDGGPTHWQPLPALH